MECMSKTIQSGELHRASQKQLKCQLTDEWTCEKTDSHSGIPHGLKREKDPVPHCNEDELKRYHAEWNDPVKNIKNIVWFHLYVQNSKIHKNIKPYCDYKGKKKEENETVI